LREREREKNESDAIQRKREATRERMNERQVKREKKKQ